MIKINVIVNNKNWFNFIKRPNDYLDDKIRRLNLKEKKFKRNQIFCTLLLSGNKEIRYLNKKFRKKNTATDILSFPFQTKKDLKIKLKSERDIYLGDIIINLNKIKFKKMQKDFKKEFDRLWIHGLAHLFGYVHKKEADFKKMQMIEKKYLNSLNV